VRKVAFWLFKQQGPLVLCGAGLIVGSGLLLFKFGDLSATNIALGASASLIGSVWIIRGFWKKFSNEKLAALKLKVDKALEELANLKKSKGSKKGELRKSKADLRDRIIYDVKKLREMVYEGSVNNVDIEDQLSELPNDTNDFIDLVKGTLGDLEGSLAAKDPLEFRLYQRCFPIKTKSN
jgi:hypothetical protein